MPGFKDFTDGSYFTADEVDGYLMRQTAMRFPTAALLVSNLPAGIREIGMMAWASDTETMYLWDGTSWKPWFSTWKTPTTIVTSGGTPWTFGNGTTVQRWRYSGGMVEMFWKFTRGSTTNQQTGIIAWSLPVAAHADWGSHSPVGQLIAADTSAGTFFSRFMICPATTTLTAAQSEAGVRLQPTTLFAPADGDIWAFQIRYQPATSVELT